jgi:hypothetical protein
MSPQPRPKRIAAFLKTMYPPAVMLPVSTASFLSVYFGTQAIGDPSIVEQPMAVGWTAIAGIATFFLLQLLIRLYDELKDVEVDLRLGRAGDPKYVNRPIVTGDITVEDLELMVRWTVAGLFLANLFLGFPVPVFAFLSVFLLVWLSFKWFFWPAVSKNVLLAFATHNPISLAVGGYVVALYARGVPEHGPLGGWIWLLLVGLWFPVAAWELGRKVRLPAEETDYDTYSKRLGWRLAGGLPALLVMGSALSVVVLLRHLGFGWGGSAWIMLVAALPVAACVRLQIEPTSANTKLQPALEAYMVLLNASLTVMFAVHYGLRWGL